MGLMRLAVAVAGVAAFTFALASPVYSTAGGSEGDAPEGVIQLLPRGGIPAIFEPHFVNADEAKIPDSAWVLGVYLNGEARAYSLNLLNHHEIVNDEIGGDPIAPVW